MKQGTYVCSLRDREQFCLVRPQRRKFLDGFRCIFLWGRLLQGSLFQAQCTHDPRQISFSSGGRRMHCLEP